MLFIVIRLVNYSTLTHGASCLILSTIVHKSTTPSPRSEGVKRLLNFDFAVQTS